LLRCSLLLNVSRHDFHLRGSVHRMASYVHVSGYMEPRIVQESVEDVTRLLHAASDQGDKFVVLTREDGGRVALVAAEVTEVDERK
jgi:hypothetical protein